MVIGLDARGFIFAPALALRLNIRFVPVRKRGKLPGPTVQAEYVKEYGADIFEMQRGVLTSSDRVVVVDDLIATGTPLQGKIDGRWVCEGYGRSGETTWCNDVGVCVYHGVDFFDWVETFRCSGLETCH